MAEKGRYCKAYLLKQMRAFDDWSEKAENARPLDKKELEKAGNGGDPDAPRTLTDDSIVYLQENHVVTDDIYKDENILFDEVTPEWSRFCEEDLAFEIPVYDNPVPPANPETDAS